ncbi:MAG: 4Fe-4S binding protein [Deltaproteobacteria bacterium]|nr:4Fe-4S binding protein [Deltaproteobacteria bacterium]
MFRKVRRIYQVVFFALFLFLVFATTASLIGGYPVEWFLAIDPLVALSAGLASREIHPLLLMSVPIIIITLIFGRFFCGWLCPFGTIHHACSFVAKKRRVSDRIKINNPRKIFKLKYFILLALLAMALLGSNQIGWLDPIAFTWRAMSTALIPALDNLAWGVYQGERHFHASSIIAFLFVVAISLNFIIPRLYCRLLCPLGALLGLLSRFSLFRLHRNLDLCNNCNVCGADCAGAAQPQDKLRVNECLLCLNCIEACPRGGIKYGFLSSSPTTTTDVINLGRRRSLAALALGVTAVPLLRASDGVNPRANPKRIRPPGACSEEEFLEKCIKCGACMKVCPTGGLQPAFEQAGIEGLWTPVLIARLGYCEQQCALCGEICPTSAIRYISLAEKLGLPPYTEPIRIGSASIDRGRCLPWANETQCIVCEEVCPTSPKAIHYKVVTIQARNGKDRTLKQPYIDLTKCVGCGICETHCPVADEAAIRVTSVGESRSRTNRVIITGGKL